MLESRGVVITLTIFDTYLRVKLKLFSEIYRELVMAIMTILRLPTEVELNSHLLESDTFFKAFNKNICSDNNFSAHVIDNGDGTYDLDGWTITDEDEDDWFKIIK